MDSEEGQHCDISHAIEDGTPTVNLLTQSKKIQQPRPDSKSDTKQVETEPEMLHTGGVLGDLPSLKSPTKSPNKYDDYTASGGCIVITY